MTELSDVSDERMEGADDGAALRPTDATEAAPAETAPTETGRRRRWRPRRIDKGLLFASFAIALGLVLVVRGLAVGITGDDRIGLPEFIEEVEPVPESVQVLNQSRVFVDLASGYTGVLVIDGVELETADIGDIAQDFTAAPGQQIDLPATTIFEGGNNTLTFVPNDDAPITGFTTGLHQVQVIYWEIGVGRERARSFTWTFNVV